MASTIVSQSSAWDSQYGGFVTQTTVSSFSQDIAIPSNAFDVQKNLADGKYTTTYKTLDSSSGGGTGGTSGYSYEMHGTLSTEPLKTHPYFAVGGKYALSTDDLEKIKLAEADATLWKTYVSGMGNLATYSKYFGIYGIDSYLVPALTLSITTQEGGLPNLTGLGKTAVPINAPQLQGNANWLLSGCSASYQAGGTWKVTREYRSSGPLGWNQYLYT